MRKIIILFLFITSLVGAQSPIIVFKEDFQSLPLGSISDAQKALWNMQQGQWLDNDLQIVSFGGAKAWEIHFTKDSVGYPLTDASMMLDSVYKDLYLTYDIWVEAGFQWANGGKNFGSFEIGPPAGVPYQSDTIHSGGNTLTLFNSSGQITYYFYTHNPTYFGYIPQSIPYDSIHRPTNESPGLGSNPSVYAYYDGKDYLWEKRASGAPDGKNNQWYGWPTKTDWFGGNKWVSNDQVMSFHSTGQWVNWTMHVKLDSAGQASDYVELFKNGTLVKVYNDMRFLPYSRPEWGIETFFLNAFFGGSTPCPADQSWYIRNMAVYYYPPGHEDYHEEPLTVGSTITVPAISGTKYLPNSLAVPQDNVYTDSSGIIRSFHIGMHQPPMMVWSYDTVAPTGASYIDLTLSQYTPKVGAVVLGSCSPSHPDYPDGCTKQDSINVYSIINGVKTIVEKKGYFNQNLETWNIAQDTVVIEYYTGSANYLANNVQGWTMTYESDGTTGGVNYDWGDARDALAYQYGITTSALPPPIDTTLPPEQISGDTLAKVNFYYTWQPSGWTNIASGSTTDVDLGGGMFIRPLGFLAGSSGIPTDFAPDSVSTQYHYISDSDNNTKQIKIYGQTDTVNISILSSRSSSGVSETRITYFSIGEDTLHVDAVGNSDSVLTFYNILPTDTIRIYMWGETNKFKYINALAVYESLTSTPTTPISDTISACDTVYAYQEVDSMYLWNYSPVEDALQSIGYFDGGGWARFEDISFDSCNINPNGVKIKLKTYSTAYEFYIVLDSINGDTVATYTPQLDTSFNVQYFPLDTILTGQRDVYFTVESSAVAGGNIEWILFVSTRNRYRNGLVVQIYKDTVRQRIPKLTNWSTGSGFDAGENQSIYVGQTSTMAGSVGVSYDSIVYSSVSLSGTFDDDNSLTAVFTPSVYDIGAGSGYIRLAVYNGGVPVYDSMKLDIDYQLPTVHYLADVPDGTDITTAIEDTAAAANNGDIIVLPRGLFTSSQIDIDDKLVSIIGYGNDSTGTFIYENTTIFDLNNSSATYSDFVFISGIYTYGNPSSYYGGSTNSDQGTSYILTGWDSLMISDVRMRYNGYSGIEVHHPDSIEHFYGLVFNSEILDQYKTELANYGYGISVYGTSYMGGFGEKWITDPEFGSEKFFFSEDNIYRFTRHAFAGGGAGKYVTRHDTVINNWAGQPIDLHGKAGANNLSTRAVEAYDNYVFTNVAFATQDTITPSTPLYSYASTGVGLRGGEALVHDNVLWNYRRGTTLSVDNPSPSAYPDESQTGYLSGVEYGSSHKGDSENRGNGDYFEWNNSWNHTYGGATPYYVQWTEFYNVDDPTYLIVGRDYHSDTIPSGYTEYEYPHPARNYYKSFAAAFMDQISGLTIGTKTTTTIDISWNDVLMEDGYHIYVNGVLNGSTTLNDTTYTITGLSSGQSYSIYVKAYNDDREGNKTTTITTSTP